MANHAHIKCTRTHAKTYLILESWIHRKIYLCGIKYCRDPPLLNFCINQYWLSVLSRATFPGAPSYSGVRTWVEGSQTRGSYIYSSTLWFQWKVAKWKCAVCYRKCIEPVTILSSTLVGKKIWYCWVEIDVHQVPKRQNVASCHTKQSILQTHLNLKQSLNFDTMSKLQCTWKFWSSGD